MEKYRILIIDDDKNIHWAIKDIFTEIEKDSEELKARHKSALAREKELQEA